MAQWLNSRSIMERITVKGNLMLETPTHLGNGDADSPLDMPLLLDPLEGKALLTGTTIAGALRNYLQTLTIDEGLIDKLFGSSLDKDGEENAQSLLIVDDALGERPRIELRDGVAIDQETHTAEPRKKFEIELLEEGTRFPLFFELVLLKNDSKRDRDELLQAFASALQGLELGRIHLGKRKRRGFGRCRANKWHVNRYDLSTPKGMIEWLEGNTGKNQEEAGIASILGAAAETKMNQSTCTLEGIFIVEGSLLIRSDYGETDAADDVHLHSKRRGENMPVLSGTSLAGALRARALRIANTLGKDGKNITDSLFGLRHKAQRENEGIKKNYAASRLWTEEALIENGLDLIQTRVKIDRFTGGTYPGALFNEQPVFGKCNSETTINISVKIENPADSEVGLLLLLLKDLWTGDLPLGGGSSVGRGRLKGKSAALIYKGKTWNFIQQNGTLQIDNDKQELELLVQSFVKGRNYE